SRRVNPAGGHAAAACCAGVAATAVEPEPGTTGTVSLTRSDRTWGPAPSSTRTTTATVSTRRRSTGGNIEARPAANGAVPSWRRRIVRRETAAPGRAAGAAGAGCYGDSTPPARY